MLMRSVKGACSGCRFRHTTIPNTFHNHRHTPKRTLASSSFTQENPRTNQEADAHGNTDPTDASQQLPSSSTQNTTDIHNANLTNAYKLPVYQVDSTSDDQLIDTDALRDIVSNEFGPKDKFNFTLHQTLNPSAKTEEVSLEAEIEWEDEVERSIAEGATRESLEKQRREDNIRLEKQRNVSRLKLYHHNTVYGRAPDMFEFSWQMNKSNLKERYAKFGIASGVNPGVHWMTKDELDEQVQWNSTQEPQFKETFLQMKKAKKDEETSRKNRIREVEENMKNHEKLLQTFLNSRKGQEAEQREIEMAREDKIREIQEYFGYAVDPSDPRFQTMMAQKEEEEKKAKRLARQREKEAKTIAQIRDASTPL